VALDYEKQRHHGSRFLRHIDVGLVIVTDNPGVLLAMDGAAHFQFDPNGFVSTNY